MKTKRFGRRRLYPMPVEALVDHPEFISLPTAAVGCLIRLVLHFWQSECRELPPSDRERRLIARAHMPTWRHYSPQVLAIFEAVKPELASYYRLREAKGTTLSLAGQKSASKSKLAVIRQSATPNQTVAAYAMGTVPKTDPRLPAKRKPQTESPRLTDRPHT